MCENKNSAKLLELLEINDVKIIATANDNFILKKSCQNKMPKVALKLLEIQAIRDNAAVNDNEALKWACENKMTEVALELLKIQAVIDNAAVNDNFVLKKACQNKMKEVALKLLEIQAVKNNAAANDNSALSWACTNKTWEVVLKLTEIQSVLDNAAANDNAVLEFACRFSFQDLALKLLELEDVKAKIASVYLALYLATFSMPEVALKLLELEDVKAEAAAYNNGAFINTCRYNMPKLALKLLELKVVKAKAAIKGNEAFFRACKNHMTEVALKLLEIESVKAELVTHDNPYQYDNRTLLIHTLDMPEVTLKLLEFEVFKAIAATNDNEVLKNACLHNMPKVASKLLEIDEVRTAVKIIAATDKHHKLLIMACKIHNFKIVQEIFALPNLAFDLTVLQETLPKEDTSDLEWHLALLLMTNPEHPLAARLSETQQISLQKRLCQDYRNLYHNYLQERLPIELLDNIIVYTNLHPQLKLLSEQDRSLKTLLSVLSRCVLLHQSLSILTGLRESKNEELLQGLLKQAAMQAEIITALDQLAGPDNIGTTSKTTEIRAWKNLGIDFDTWRNLEDSNAKTAHLQHLTAQAPAQIMIGLAFPPTVSNQVRSRAISNDKQTNKLSPKI